MLAWIIMSKYLVHTPSCQQQRQNCPLGPLEFDFRTPNTQSWADHPLWKLKFQILICSRFTRHSVALCLPNHDQYYRPSSKLVLKQTSKIVNFWKPQIRLKFWLCRIFFYVLEVFANYSINLFHFLNNPNFLSWMIIHDSSSCHLHVSKSLKN